jgi:hypothetical protein
MPCLLPITTPSRESHLSKLLILLVLVRGVIHLHVLFIYNYVRIIYIAELDSVDPRAQGGLINISGKGWIDELLPARRVNCYGGSALKNMKMPHITNPTFPTRLFHTRDVPTYNVQRAHVDKLELLLHHRFSIQVPKSMLTLEA